MLRNALCRALAIASCILAYAWFTDEAILSESIAAVIVGIAAYLAAARFFAGEPADARLSPRVIVPFFTRVIPAMFRESFDLVGPVLWRRLVLRESTTGRWIALRYDPHDTSRESEYARRTAVIFASNLTPNALPLDIDVGNERMILHQLVHRRESAASDPRYPI